MELVFDFGAKRIKIIEGRFKKGKVMINNKLIIDIPENMYQMLIMNKNSEFSRTIKLALKNKSIKSKKCSVVLKNSEFSTREFVLPKTNRNNMLKLIANQMNAVLGNASSCYVDYIVTEELQEDKKRLLKVNAYAINKKLVGGYYDFFQSAGLKPQRVDIDSNCLRKLIALSPLVNGQKLGSVTLFADLGLTMLGLDLIVNNRLVFSKTIPFTSHLTEYLRHRKVELFIDDTKPQIEESKKKLFAFISEEIYRIMQFSMASAIRQPVNKVLMYGGNRNIPDICEAISDELGIEVSLLESVSSIGNAGKVADILIPSSSLIKLK